MLCLIMTAELLDESIDSFVHMSLFCIIIFFRTLLMPIFVLKCLNITYTKLIIN